MVTWWESPELFDSDDTELFFSSFRGSFLNSSFCCSGSIILSSCTWLSDLLCLLDDLLLPLLDFLSSLIQLGEACDCLFSPSFELFFREDELVLLGEEWGRVSVSSCLWDFVTPFGVFFSWEFVFGFLSVEEEDWSLLVRNGKWKQLLRGLLVDSHMRQISIRVLQLIYLAVSEVRQSWKKEWTVFLIWSSFFCKASNILLLRLQEGNAESCFFCPHQTIMCYVTCRIMEIRHKHPRFANDERNTLHSFLVKKNGCIGLNG